MNEQDSPHAAATDHEDLNTTPPNPAIEMPSPGNSVSGGWVMPKPVFRQSSGQPAVRENKYTADAEYGNEDVTGVPSSPESWDDDEPVVFESTPADIAGAQPELADILPYDPEPVGIAPEPAARPDEKRSSGALIFVVAAILVIGFIALLLTVVYYLFLRPPGTEGVF